MEVAEQRRQVDQPDRGHGADPQCAAQSPSHFVHSVHRGAGGIEGGARFGEQGGTGVGEVDPLRGALEQRGPQLLFEGLDRGRHPRLHDVELLRRPGEVPGFGHRHEVLQVAELHPKNHNL
jgi:hypothetical protein